MFYTQRNREIPPRHGEGERGWLKEKTETSETRDACYKCTLEWEREKEYSEDAFVEGKKTKIADVFADKTNKIPNKVRYVHKIYAKKMNIYYR